jgi:hypothetical protein
MNRPRDADARGVINQPTTLLVLADEVGQYAHVVRGMLNWRLLRISQDPPMYEFTVWGGPERRRQRTRGRGAQ